MDSYAVKVLFAEQRYTRSTVILCAACIMFMIASGSSLFFTVLFFFVFLGAAIRAYADHDLALSALNAWANRPKPHKED